MKNQNVISDENVVSMYKQILSKPNVSEETKSQIVIGLNEIIKSKLNKPSSIRIECENLIIKLNK